MSNGAPLLELEGVSKRFGPVQALDRVDFAVHAGEVIGLVGDNGAGKSTLVKTIAGIHAADTGTIRFAGEEVSITKAPGRDRTGDRHRLPGPRPLRQPRRRCQPLPRTRGGLARAGHDLAAARRVADGAPDRRAALQPRGDDPEPAQRGRNPFRGTAAAGGGRPFAAGRAQGGASGRANGGARGRPDRAGAGT